MKASRLITAVLLCGLLATACGPKPDGSTATASATTPPPMVEAPAEADAAPAPEATATLANETAVEESAASDPDASPGRLDLPAEAVPAAPAAWKYEEGKHYRALPSAQGTSSSPDKIEVAEVFWYGCPHCYNLEPQMKDWVQKLPADVSFVRIPVMWSPVHEIHARAFYTAEALGKLDAVTDAMFRGMHIENRPLTEEGDIRRLFENVGVSAEDFNRTFRSFAVDSQLKRARDLTGRYRVRGVPLLVVNGKYTTEGPELKSNQDLLGVAAELIERERQR